MTPDPRSVPCPHCGAEVGDPCRVPSGTVIRAGDEHGARRRKVGIPKTRKPTASKSFVVTLPKARDADYLRLVCRRNGTTPEDVIAGLVLKYLA